MIGSAVQAALQGLQTHQRAFARHADAIGRAGTAPDAGLRPADVAGLLSARHGYEANLAVLRRGDEMVGSLLDVLA